MRDGMIIADAVIHGYNWTSANYANPLAAELAAGTVGAHQGIFSKPDESQLKEEEFINNWDSGLLEDTLIHETEVDLVAYHGTPIWDYWKDGHSDYRKGLELRDKYPGRVLIYGPLNPYHGQRALEEMKFLVEEVGVDGLKVFAASYHEGRTISQPLNDPKVAYPFIEQAIDLGVKVIATHKAIPLGPVRHADYNVHDMDEPASRYPEVNFEIVHSGFAFLEETAMVVDRHPNVFANFEATNSFAIKQQRRWADVLGTFLWYGGEDSIIFASGCALVHPQPLIDALADFEMPADLVEGFGYKEFTPERKAKLLGQNYMRMHGIDPEDFKKRTANDAWAKARGERSMEPVWSNARSREDFVRVERADLPGVQVGPTVGVGG